MRLEEIRSQILAWIVVWMKDTGKAAQEGRLKTCHARGAPPPPPAT